MTSPSLEPPTSARTHRHAGFQTTQWSLVLEAGRPVDAAAALERLCRDYWPPIYACVRYSGRNREEAQDITQDFFASLLRYESIGKVDPSKGRFRSFLRAALRNFLSNRWHRERARKRGGGRPPLSLDAVPALERELLEHEPELTPEEAFDRSWAQTALARVLTRLRHEYEAGGQGERFDVLKIYLLAGRVPAPYAESATRLGLSEAAVKSAIHTLRRRYGEMLRAEIAQTLSDPREVDEEIRHLLRVLTA